MRTQKADREFDQFNSYTREILTLGGNPEDVFLKPQYKEGSESYLNVFRYFAKLLCCHLAEIQAPRPRRLSEFAISRMSGNCLWLTVQRDLTFTDMSELFDEPHYASHGGLLVYVSKSTGVSDRFYSSLSIGPIQYLFYYELAWIEKLELAWVFKEFTESMKQNALETEKHPIRDSDWRRLGMLQ